MKKFFALMLVLALASSASAEVLDGGYFTAEVPEGWTCDSAPEDAGSRTALLKAPDSSLILTVSMLDLPPEGGTVRTLAERLCQVQKGRGLEKMEDGDEAYQYDATVNGVSVYAQVFALDGEKAGFICVLGDHEDSLAVDIFNSVKFK